MHKDLVNELETTNNSLLEILASFPEEQFNKSPYEGSWTPAQVGQHLFKSDLGLLKLLNSPAKPVDRAPDQYVQHSRDLFLNFEKKFDAPGFIIPENRKYDQAEMLQHLQQSRTRLHEALETLDLSQMPEVNETPLKGSTRLELGYFILYHTQRHIHQLKNIATLLK
ncbi:MAG TPA: DinB family protein [Chitinophagaceae bacterium]|nr:DinB family protein [Chitinophagaceae bacterium]